MNPRHKISPAGIELIKSFEGYRRRAAQLPDGRWTIGYGHTKSAREGAEVSEADATALLLYDLMAVTSAVNDLSFTPLTQNQFDALVCFAFNVGVETFRKSTVLRRVNEGSMLQAACSFEMWRKAEFEGERIVVDALVRRRSAEKALFLTPADGAWLPVPSAVLPPQLDADAVDVVPLEIPSLVKASMDGESIVVTREFSPQTQPSALDEFDGPAKAAAEAVTARLQTIFQEPADEPAAQAVPVEPPVHPENIPEAPQADFGPPLDVPAETAPPEVQAPDPGAPDAARLDGIETEPFTLRSSVDDGADSDPLVGAEGFETAAEDDLRGPDLFDPSPAPGDDGLEAEPAVSPTPANDPDHQPAEDLDTDLAFLSRGPDYAHEVPFKIDPSEAIEFVAPAVEPLPEQPRGGFLTLVASAVLGLAFFGGGVFWATNARPMAGSMWLDPRVVGWLAVLSGIGFFTVSAFLLLERLGQASERSARERR